MEDLWKTPSFITKEIKSAVTTILERLCCKKVKDNKPNTEEAATQRKIALISQNTCLSQNDQCNDRSAEAEEPWMKKYYQTATYYHGQFDSDVESEDDEIESETHKKDDIVKALGEKGGTTVDVDGAEVFDFPF